MTKFTNANTRRLARLIFKLKDKERSEVISYLDTDFRSKVVEEIQALKQDTPVNHFGEFTF